MYLKQYFGMEIQASQNDWLRTQKSSKICQRQKQNIKPDRGPNGGRQTMKSNVKTSS